MMNEGNESSATKNQLWYLATMNDGLFIVNRKPQPAPIDVTNTSLTSPEIVIPLPGNDRFTQRVAEIIVAVHNAEIQKHCTAPVPAAGDDEGERMRAAFRDVKASLDPEGKWTAGDVSNFSALFFAGWNAHNQKEK